MSNVLILKRFQTISSSAPVLYVVFLSRRMRGDLYVWIAFEATGMRRIKQVLLCFEFTLLHITLSKS